MSTRQDVYSRVTNKIIADLEDGIRTWNKPWNSDHLAGNITRPIRHNDEPYNGMNILLLWSASCEHGYFNNRWMTYRQAKELGGQVRKGEQGEMVVYANTMTREETNKSGETVDIHIPYMKSYTVFNVEQIDGLPDELLEQPEPVTPGIERDARLEAFFAATKADIHHKGAQAYYTITHDHVVMPPIESFYEPEGYYATLAHEMTHWTRHPSRLDRDFGRKKFGDEGYAREELVAELAPAPCSQRVVPLLSFRLMAFVFGLIC